MASKPKTAAEKQAEKDALEKLYRAKIAVIEAHVGKLFAREYQFYRQRSWKIDFALVCCKLAIEIEGGTWSGGRHTRGSGFVKDVEKYNMLTVEGWRLLRFNPAMLKDNSYLHAAVGFFQKQPCTHNPIGQGDLFN